MAETRLPESVHKALDELETICAAGLVTSRIRAARLLVDRAVAAAIKEAHEPSLWACRCGHAQFADPAEVSGGTCLSCGEAMDAYALVAAALEAGNE